MKAGLFKEEVKKIGGDQIMVSVVICTLNSERFIDQVITSIKKLRPFEIIVVDGNSKDNTVNIANKHEVKVVYDNGSGLGNARNIGLGEAKGDYVLYVGPDNILSENLDFDELIHEMMYNQWVGIGLRSELTNLANIKGFEKQLSDGLNLRWKNKIKPGQANVIGTPFMFKRATLNKLTFNAKSKFSDDTEICDRMRRQGLRIGYSTEVLCYDIWRGIKESIIDRFKMYGKSDREYFKSNYKNWKMKRIIQSLLHPFNEFKIIKKFNDIKYLPFIIYIVFWRYIGYGGL